MLSIITAFHTSLVTNPNPNPNPNPKPNPTDYLGGQKQEGVRSLET